MAHSVPTALLLTISIQKTEAGILLNLKEVKHDRVHTLELMPGKATFIRTDDNEPIISIHHIPGDVPIVTSPLALGENNTPNWTLITNIDNGDFVGMQWEFFKEEKKARARYLFHVEKNNRCPVVLRRFHETTDRQHMGACHR